MRIAPLLSALLVVLAGCVANSPGPSGPLAGPNGVVYDTTRHDIPEDPMPEGAGHDHADPAQHKFLWNYDFGSRDPLLQNAANTAGVHALDLQAGYLFGAVYGSHAAAVDGGLVIWDLADPAHPVETGRWTIPGSVGGDRSMEATPDGAYAVISTESMDCVGHVNPAGVVATYLIDTRDKSNPVVADVITFTGQSLGGLQAVEPNPRLPGVPFGDHSVSVHRIGGQDYAFVWGRIYHIERSESGASLVPVSAIFSGHDLYVRDTPWNTTWALSANGDGENGGLVVWDVTDPAEPFQLAIWKLPEEEDREHYFHTADASFQPDGQVLVVLTSEDFTDNVSPFWVLDGNPLIDVASPPPEPIVLERLGNWSNPGQHVATSSLRFSLHNPRFHDGGILSVSGYHGGVWQFDLRAPDFWRDPSPIAYAVYAEGEPTVASDPVEGAISSQLCGLGITLDAPSYWDVEVGANGALYLADAFLGLYAFTPTADHPVFGANRTADFFGTAGT